MASLSIFLTVFLLGSLAGCADQYRVSDAAVVRLAQFPDTARPRIAIVAIRERGQQPAWVRSDLILLDPNSAPGSNFHTAREANSTRRISPFGLTSLIAGTLGVSLGVVFVATANACSSPGALPCLRGGGDAAVSTSLVGAGLFFTGLGTLLARATDMHPAEVPGGDENLLYLGVPSAPDSAAKTPLE